MPNVYPVVTFFFCKKEGGRSGECIFFSDSLKLKKQLHFYSSTSHENTVCAKVSSAALNTMNALLSLQVQ